MKKRIILILLAVFLCLLSACGKTETPPQPDPVPAGKPQQEDTVPEISRSESAAEVIPVVLPEPEPELHEPLWSGVPEARFVREIQRTSDTVTVFEAKAGSHLRLRLYQMEAGDRVTMGRLQNAAGELTAYAWTAEGTGSLRWYDRSAGQWQEQALTPGRYTPSMLELTMENGKSWLIYPPKSYRPQENGVLEYLPDQDGWLSIAKTGGGWQFSLLAALPDTDCVSDFTMVQGPRPMLNWEHHYCGELWKNYTMDTEGKWCFDGYYWPCPGNYTPTGENYLYCCPAAYLIKSFAYAAPAHPAADDLALAMLDTMAARQNTEGFWPTTPRSEWLYTDYGVDKGFYDTRFNTDLLEIYRVYYEYAGGDVLLEAMETHLAFFTAFAERAHFTSENGGWFIPDYDPATGQTPHCSLNHLLAECIELYRLADVLQRPDLELLADKMLLAVTDTREQWISETGDLHYCIFPDGTFGRQDYPYLTYNDLLELQNLLIERNGQPDEALQFLMDQKRQWMDANGITQYNH